MKKYLITLIFSLFLLIGFLYEREIIFLSSDENIKVFQNSKNKIDIVIDSKENEKTKINIDKIGEIEKIEINGEEVNKNEILNKDFEKGTIISIETKQDKEDLEKNIIENSEIIQEEILENKEEIILGDLNIKLNKNNYSSNINNLIEFSGENLNNIDFITIGEISYKPNIDGNKAYVLINIGSYNSGDYFIIVQEKNGKINYLDEKINFTYSNEKISVANITPNIINNKTNNYIVLQGEGFNKILRIQLSNNIVLEETNFDIINENVLSLLIPKGINPGEYYLNIMDIDGIYKINNKITIK